MRRPTRPRHPPPAFALFPPRSQIGIVGATSGVGQHVIRRLAHDSLPVRAIVRDASRARSLLPASVTVSEIASTADADVRRLRASLRGLRTLFICTGTTAFPTRAWSNGNTPAAVDVAGMRNLVRALDAGSVRQVVLLSSIGTRRTRELPFAIVNLFGVLDAKREGERILAQAAGRGGFRWSIVRPGRLVGGPHTNVGMRRRDEEEGMQDVEVLAGDGGKGNCSREKAAEAMLMAWRSGGGFDFSVVEKAGERPSRLAWQQKLMATRAVKLDAA